MYTIVNKKGGTVNMRGNWPGEYIAAVVKNHGIENVVVISTYSMTLKIPISIDEDGDIEYNEFPLPLNIINQYAHEYEGT